MISRNAKQAEQDSDRHDDRGSSSVRGDTRTEVKGGEIGTSKALRDTEVPKSASNSANSGDASERFFGRAALSIRQTRANTHDRIVALGPSESNHSSPFLYFPLNYRFPSHYPHPHYKSNYIFRSRGYYYHQPHYHHQHHRPFPPSEHSMADHNTMAPFDDTTLATSNVSNKNIKTGNRSLTVDTTLGKSDMKQQSDRYPRPYPPAYYHKNHGEYYHHPGSHREEQHFEFHDNDSMPECDYEFSTTPIAINTPQRSNTSSRFEAQNRNEGNQEERHANLNSNNAVSGDRYAQWKFNHNSSGYYNYPPYYPHGREYTNRGFDSEHQRRVFRDSNTTGKNISARSTTATSQPPQEDRRPAPYSSRYYLSGWYPAYEGPQEPFPPEEPYDRHYFSPSPPPPPPSPYSDFYMPSPDMFTSGSSSPSMSWYEGHRGSFDEHDASRRAPVPPFPFHPNNGHHYPAPPAHEDKKRPGTPSSNQSIEKIPKVTPTTGRKSPSISNTDMSAKQPSSFSSSSNAVVTPADKSGATPASPFKPSSPFVTLRDNDIVCGRGAPTNYHIGNERFKELVSDYHRSYFVAKRSDKPRIAMKILDVLSSNGARFVRRIKGGSLASSHWEEVAHKIAYEKVCQALRDAGGPPRKMLSSVAASSRNSNSSPNRSARNSSNLPLAHQPKNRSRGGEEEGKENCVVDKY